MTFRPRKALTWTPNGSYTPRGLQKASMAELVDAADSKSASGDRVGVRFSLEAPFDDPNGDKQSGKHDKTGLSRFFCVRTVHFYG